MKQYLTKTLCDFISIPSVSGNEEKLSTRIYSELKKAAISVTRNTDGNIVAKTGKGKKRLIFNGHIDTVPAENWKHNPFKPRIAGNKIYGRGASDMKSGLSVMMYLAKNIKPNLEVFYTFTVCEERRDLKPNGAEAFSKKVQADYIVSLEPTVSRKMDICIASQGRILAHVDIKGRACHSSTPGLGENAISNTGKIVSRVDRLNNTLKTYGIYRNCCGKPAISVTEIRAGVATNVIPDSCKIIIDRRLGIYEKKSDFKKDIGKILSKIPCRKLTITDDHPMSVTKINGKLFNALNSSYREIMGFNPGYIVTCGAYDNGFFYERGMDVIDIGPGLKHQCHVENEYCRISDMVDCTEVLNRMMLKLV